MAEPSTAETLKSKKKKNVQEVDENLSVDKKKNKKRKFDEAMETDEEVVQKPKKKLNVLLQIEDPRQHQQQERESTKTKSQVQDLLAPLASQKLKKVIPQNLELAKKKRKKKSAPKVIPEPPTSLPRPVWSSAGIFVEQPISPYKFKSTNYVPISTSASCATKFGVMTFEGKKKKKQTSQQPQQHVDYKTQMMFRNMKNRDGSIKNLRGLLGAHNTN